MASLDIKKRLGKEGYKVSKNWQVREPLGSLRLARTTLYSWICVATVSSRRNNQFSFGITRKHKPFVETPPLGFASIKTHYFTWMGETIVSRLQAKRFAFRLSLRKEVIQPHLPVRLPCYDFTLLTKRTFGAVPPCGLD